MPLLCCLSNTTLGKTYTLMSQCIILQYNELDALQLTKQHLDGEGYQGNKQLLPATTTCCLESSS